MEATIAHLLTLFRYFSHCLHHTRANLMMMTSSCRMARAACRFGPSSSRSFCGAAAAHSATENNRSTLCPQPSHEHHCSVEGQLWRTALEEIKRKQRDEINNLQWLKESLRMAQMTPSTATVTTTNPQQPQNTFQVMNRNARKAKRANHGKRPCSRDRRRWKTRSWANPSRRG
jgi:hypothetical protein